MARIAPFRGILYDNEKIKDLSKVVAPPYDVISPEDREKLYRRSPYNMVRLILSREPDPYEGVGNLFAQWQEEGVLRRDPVPSIYFLKHRFQLRDGEEKERRGFIALARLEDFTGGKIHPHENTLAKPKEDRFRILLACNANLSPIFGLYADPDFRIDRLLDSQVESLLPSAEASDGTSGLCRLWRITDSGVIRRIQEEMKSSPLLIADGHHRYEAALRYRDYLLGKAQAGAGEKSVHYVMMYFSNMKDNGLVVLPTHRLVRGFAPIPFEKLEASLQRYFRMEQYPKTRDGMQEFLRDLRIAGKKGRSIGASFKKDPRYLILRLKNKRLLQSLSGQASAALRELDVSVVHRVLLEEILGLTQEIQKQEEVVRYLENEEEALKAVEKGEWEAAFILNPPSPEDIFAVAQQGEKMPQKSTYFYPKLLSGLVIHRIVPAEEVG